MTIKEKLLEKQNELVALKARIEAGDAEAITAGEVLVQEIDTLEAQVKAAKKAAEKIASIGESAEPVGDGKKSTDPMAEIVSKAKNVDTAVKGWSVNGSLPSIARKANTDVVTGVQLAEYDRGGIAIPQREAVADLFGSLNISGNAYTFFLENAWVGDNSTGTPAVVAEGAEKPQGSTGFTPKTVALGKIAGFVKETSEILEDAPFLVSAIQNTLLYRLGLVEDATIMAAVLATSGLQTADYGVGGDSDTLVNGILYAKRLVAQNSPFKADFVAINPEDMYELLTAVDGNGQYLGGGYFMAPYGNGQYSQPARIWGLPVFETSTVQAGTVLVGAGKQGVNIVRKGGTQVKIYEQNEDDAIYNRVTLLAEERLVTAVKYPAALVKLTAHV